MLEGWYLSIVNALHTVHGGMHASSLEKSYHTKGKQRAAVDGNVSKMSTKNNVCVNVCSIQNILTTLSCHKTDIESLFFEMVIYALTTVTRLQ